MSRRQQDKYVQINLNGRLFPTWILANYKYYKLPEVVKTEEDPCTSKSTVEHSKRELRKYQLFISKYLSFNSPYRNILLYHGVGSGKTGTTINLYNVLYNYSPGWTVYILLRASLRTSLWIPELEKWLQNEEKKFRLENIKFISYDAPNADKQFFDEVKSADTSKKSMYIIEEAHNFIRNVYSNVSTRQGRRAQSIYDYIIQDLKESESSRVILLTGTPAVNSPYELALLFNLLRPGIFPRSETAFYQEFVSAGAFQTLNPAKKNMFQRRIMGLVSYYIGATPDYFATKRIEYIDVKMSEYHEDIYNYFDAIEEQQQKKSRMKLGKASETYKSYTRQACNFVFPFMKQNMTGELRVRPSTFKLSEKDIQMTNIGKETKDTKSYYNVQSYLEAIDNYVKTFVEYMDNKYSEDEKNQYTIQDDVKVFNEKYKKNYVEFHNKEEKKSDVYKELHKCSAKMLYIIFNILTSPGPVIVYSNYVLVEGLQIFKIYLKYFGFGSINDDNNKSSKDNFRYTEYHGRIDQETRVLNLKKFNDPENKYGAICKILMISGAGSEGLNTMSVRQVHIMEPYWNEARIIQVQGRAIRFCSHKYLPKEERHVDIFRYSSIRRSDVKWTTDQYIENLARSKEGLIQSFLDAMKEVAVDCVLNKTHNSLTENFKCFQFDETSLFDEQIGPAYKDDFYDDMRIDNGSNSIHSQTIRIKVIKIKAVRQLSKPEETPKYSRSENYWYNPDTGVVYDFDLHYAIGKISYDNDNLPRKLDKDVYIIDKIIPIPIIED